MSDPIVVTTPSSPSFISSAVGGESQVLTVPSSQAILVNTTPPAPTIVTIYRAEGDGIARVDDFTLVALAGYPNAYSVATYNAEGLVTERLWKVSAAGANLLRHTFTYPSAAVSVRVETSYRAPSPVTRTVTVTQSGGGVVWEVS
jgi:hypothetical protein